MTAQIINGKEIAKSVRLSLKEKISQLQTPPALAVILVGSNPASQVYVKSKEKACLEVGITPKTYTLEENTTQEQLINLIHDLNNDANINGILVQLPLPSHIDTQKVLKSINVNKDVDGFHPENVGLVIQQQPNGFVPCTPKGVLHLLASTQVPLEGLNAVVVGRSQIVGLPMAHLLISKNCTVTVTHSKTKNLKDICKAADVLVVALGKPEFITKEHIKEGAIVIDVGINRTELGLKGDVNYEDALSLASYITPVPGGVGPMTIAMLLENTYLAYLMQHNS